MTTPLKTRIGPFNLNEKHIKNIINSGAIPIRKLEIDLNSLKYLLKDSTIGEKLVNEFPKEWIEFQNGEFFPLYKIRELKNESYIGKVLNYFTDLIEEDKKERPPYFKNIYDAKRGIFSLEKLNKIRRLQVDLENKKLILLNHIL